MWSETPAPPVGRLLVTNAHAGPLESESSCGLAPPIEASVQNPSSLSIRYRSSGLMT